MTDRTIYKAINAVQSELAQKGIDKTQENTFDRYKFRGIDDVMNALAPLLAKHGLIIIPEVTDRALKQVQTSQGKTTNHAVVTVNYQLCDTHGDMVKGVFVGEAMDRGDKALNKALTAAFKYFLFETFCIPVKGTEDADSESHEVVEQEVALLSDDQRQELLGLCMQSNTNVEKFCEWLGYPNMTQIPEPEFNRAKHALENKLAIATRAYEQEQVLTHQSMEGEGQ